MSDKAALDRNERRRHRRFPCSGFAEVVAFHPRLLFRGRVRDISRSGCFIETGARVNLRRMTEVELQFTTHGIQLKSRARLMDVQPGRGAGFEFLSGDPRTDRSFLKLIDSLNAEADHRP